MQGVGPSRGHSPGTHLVQLSSQKPKSPLTQRQATSLANPEKSLAPLGAQLPHPSGWQNPSTGSHSWRVEVLSGKAFPMLRA